MKRVTDHLGFGFLTNNAQMNLYTPPFPSLKNRIRDQFIQDWHSYINRTPKLMYSCNFKTDFKFEKYLHIIKNDQLRIHLTQIRLSSHTLEIETGRRSGYVI